MDASLTLQKDHLDQLLFLLGDDKREGAAYLLCGHATIISDPWHSRSQKKLLSYSVVPIENIVSASSKHITWRTDSFVSLLKRAQADNLVVGIVHSHPPGSDWFSQQDDKNEAELLKLAQHRNGSTVILLSLLHTPTGVRGRLWSNPQKSIPLSMIRIIGSRIKLEYPKDPSIKASEAWDRQALAFGNTLNQDLRNLRIGVVGCGGTGSAVAILLSRLGVGKIALFDQDTVETTNLNRLHGANQDDARSHRAKVEVVRREIHRIGLDTQVMTYQNWLDAESCRDALKACDVIFGCTDDHNGRLLLNRLAYFYSIPVFDMGLAIDVSQEDPPHIKDLSGRVTVVRPGTPCLLCRKVVNVVRAREEQLQRTNHEEYQRQKREAYVLGEGDPNPAVVTFTTEVAAMAVNELLHHMNGFHTPAGEASEWRRLFHHMKDRKIGSRQLTDCPLCFDRFYWGRGDVTPFLDRVG